MNGMLPVPSDGFAISLFKASVPALIAGLTAIIIMSQRQAVLEADLRNHITGQAVLETRIGDLDAHGTRGLASVESHIKEIADRNLDEDRRIAAVETLVTGINVRLVVIEDRLASCQGCHMGGGAKALTDHFIRQHDGTKSVPLPSPAPIAPLRKSP